VEVSHSIGSFQEPVVEVIHSIGSFQEPVVEVIHSIGSFQEAVVEVIHSIGSFQEPVVEVINSIGSHAVNTFFFKPFNDSLDFIRMSSNKALVFHSSSIIMKCTIFYVPLKCIIFDLHLKYTDIQTYVYTFYIKYKLTF